MRFQQTGGLKIGRDIFRCWNIGWPFARLVITNDALEVRVFLFGVTKRYSFSRDEIVALQSYRTAFSCGVRIEHCKADCPTYIAFEAFPPRHFQSLIENLRDCNYSVLLER